jgi:hypothetical protein
MSRYCASCGAARVVKLLADLTQTSPKFFELLEQRLQAAPYLHRTDVAKLRSPSPPDEFKLEQAGEANRLCRRARRNPDGFL